jgi:N-acetylglucosamine transport system substrate-binding protein
MRWLAAALVGSIVLAGCSSGPAPGSGSESPKSSGSASAVPQAPTGDGDVGSELEVAAFKGGYGIDFYEGAAKEFASKHEGMTVNLWGDPRVWEQLRPKFAGGTPPDLTFPGWGMDHWGLVAEGQIFALDNALDSKVAEGEGTWRSTFDPKILKLCQQDGHTWMLPYYVMFYGWWYDENVFKANGWEPPKTWSEFLALSEKAKAKGMAPITFQGKYPYYSIEGMLLPWCFSAGGVEAIRAAQNLEPGAWKSEAMLAAASMIDELNKKGFFQNGAVGLSHTEAQMELLLGRAAMIPCGSWLESEMSKQLDEIAKSGKPRPKLRFFLPPVLDDEPAGRSNMLIGIEPWMVPAKGKNPNGAVALFKHMTSLSVAKRFVTEKGSLMSIVGSDEVALPESLVRPAAAYKSAETIWSNQFRAWYPEFNKELENALTALMSKTITPQEFCDRVEAKAEEIRKDDEIVKRKVSF